VIKLDNLVVSIESELIDLRRDFHQHPELGWREFYTTSKIIKYLKDLGYEVRYKEDIFKKEFRQGLPTKVEFEKSYKQALEWGADPKILDEIKDGFTGAVAVLETKNPDPITAFRFDIDAIGTKESEQDSHRPLQENFRSKNPEAVHSCGHDGHIAIGLGLAKLLKKLEEADKLNGKFILIFQPAEEGVRGARAIAETDLLNNVDYFLSGHIGMDANNTNSIICGITGSLFTKKIDIDILGESAHAGGAPEKGRNALLAATNLVSTLYSLNQHGQGMSRVNVGKLEAGTYRNVIPENAQLQMEIRGENKEVISYLYENVKNAVQGIEKIYNVEIQLEIVGEAVSMESDPKLINIVKKSAKDIEEIAKVKEQKKLQGSEDASFLMQKVQEQNGQASYINFGTELKAGHHQNNFDFDETVLPIAVKVYLAILAKLDIINNNK